LLLVAFLLVNAPNCHLSLVLASVVQGDAVNCKNCTRTEKYHSPLTSAVRQPALPGRHEQKRPDQSLKKPNSIKKGQTHNDTFETPNFAFKG